MTPPRPYFESDGIVLYHGDSSRLIHGLVGDCLITDPPYGVDLGDHKGAMERRGGYLVKGGYDEYLDTAQNLREIVVPIVCAALKVCQSRGAVFVAGHRICEFPPPVAVGGVYLPAACGRHPWGFNSLSHVLLYGKSPNIKNGCMATAIRSTAISPKNGHPCPKPIHWMRWLVNLATTSGEVIIDPFAGSGSTLVASLMDQRSAIGIELHEPYCEIAAKRIEAAQRGLSVKDIQGGQTSIFDMGATE